LKRVRKELMETSDPVMQMHLMQTAHNVLAGNGDGGAGHVDLNSHWARRLDITGNEGRLTSAIYDLLEPEVLTEERVREMISSRKREERSPITPTTTASVPASSSTLSTPSLNQGQLFENISDSSNSSHYFPNTPGTPGGMHDAGQMEPVSGGLYSNSQSNLALTTSTVSSGTPVGPLSVWGSEVKVPRRVPLLTSPLTMSPLKNPAFASPNRSKYCLRSSGRLPMDD